VNQGRKQIEGCISNKQRAIQTTGHVQTMQFTGNIPKDDQ